MQILLLSMPDSFEHTPTIAVRMPNGALASLAANVDPHHHVAVADLVLAQASVRRTVEQLIRDTQPDVVGLSVMTFQRSTARRIISLIRSLKPGVRVVVGGYDPSLAPEAWTNPDIGVDVIVRGEGDLIFRDLVRALERGTPLSAVAGLCYRDGLTVQRTLPRLNFPAKRVFDDPCSSFLMEILKSTGPRVVTPCSSGRSLPHGGLPTFHH